MSSTIRSIYPASAPGEADTLSTDAIVDAWLVAFEAALVNCDADALAELLTQDGNWRDVLAFTWHLTPKVGAMPIAEALIARQPAVQASGFGRSPER